MSSHGPPTKNSSTTINLPIAYHFNWTSTSISTSSCLLPALKLLEPTQGFRLRGQKIGYNDIFIVILSFEQPGLIFDGHRSFQAFWGPWGQVPLIPQYLGPLDPWVQTSLIDQSGFAPIKKYDIGAHYRMELYWVKPMIKQVYRSIY